VVAPITDTRFLNSSKFDLDFINEEFKSRGYNFEKELDRLVEINQQPIKLNLASNPQKGYYVDYSLRFDKYLNGWGSRDYSSGSYHPQVLGYSRVSLPSYDPETGYVLVNYDFFSNVNERPFSGSTIDAYLFKDGKLNYLASSGLVVR
jgi:hypothetical protein